MIFLHIHNFNISIFETYVFLIEGVAILIRSPKEDNSDVIYIGSGLNYRYSSLKLDADVLMFRMLELEANPLGIITIMIITVTIMWITLPTIY